MAKTKKEVAANKGTKKDNTDAKERLTELGMPTSLAVGIGQQTLLAVAKEFSTGSVGYNCSGKVMVGDENTSCQVGMNIIVVGSKK